MKFNEFYSLTIVHSRDIILVKGVDYMNITKQKSQKTFDKQAADYDTNIQGEHARKLYKPIIENLKNKNIHSILDLGCGTGALLKEIKELNIYIDFERYKQDILCNFSKMKKRNINKCIEMGMELRKLEAKEEISMFHKILSKNLMKYNTKPVHSLDEMLDLKKRLKNEIEFYGVYYNGQLMAGTMVFIFEKAKCAHTQYLASDPDYLKLNAMSFVYYKMIQIYIERQFRYLSWGTATEHGGEVINWNLANNKEEFGSIHGINSIFEKEFY